MKKEQLLEIMPPSNCLLFGPHLLLFYLFASEENKKAESI